MSSGGVFVFALVSADDRLIYSANFTSPTVIREEPPHLDEFILYSALDSVDRLKTSASNDSYLRVVDRFNDFLVSGFLAVSGVRLLLLHRPGGTLGTGEEVIRIFFQEIYLLYTKLLLNPEYSPHGVIRSENFDRAVRDLAKKLLSLFFRVMNFRTNAIYNSDLSFYERRATTGKSPVSASAVTCTRCLQEGVELTPAKAEV